MSAREEIAGGARIGAVAAAGARSYSSSAPATIEDILPLDDSSPDPEPVAKAILIGFALGALVSIPAILAALMSAGAGHGDYVLARALFPVPMLLTLVEGSIGQLAMTVGLLQFPVYGALFGWANVRGNHRPVILAGAAHLVAGAACFSGILPGFS